METKVKQIGRVQDMFKDGTGRYIRDVHSGIAHGACFDKVQGTRELELNDLIEFETSVGNSWEIASATPLAKNTCFGKITKHAILIVDKEIGHPITTIRQDLDKRSAIFLADKFVAIVKEQYVPKVTEYEVPCENEDCRECCEHDDQDDHHCCLICGSDRSEDAFESEMADREERTMERKYDL